MLAENERLALELQRWCDRPEAERRQMIGMRARSPMRPRVGQDGTADLPLFQTNLEEFTS